MKRSAHARLMLLGGLLLLAAPMAPAAVPPQGDPVADRTYEAADLYIASGHQPLSRLPQELRLGLQAQVSALGVPTQMATYDLRGGRWAMLLPATPLVPGSGVRNALTWAGLGVAAPRSEAAYKDAVWLAFRGYLDANRAHLGIDTSELGRPSIGSYESGRLVHINVDRVVNGVPVRRSFVKGTLNNGNLVLYGAQNWGTIDVSPTPTVSRDDSQAVVDSHLKGFRIMGWRKSRLVIVPTANGEPSVATLGGGYRYRLAWAVGPDVEHSDGGWEGLVDAHSGELLAFYDTNQYVDQKKVVGGIFPVSNDGQSPGGVPDGIEQPSFPMSRAYVFKQDGTQVEANSEGLVPVDGQYRTRLTGPFVRIVDNCGLIDEPTTCAALNLGMSGGTDCSVPPGTRRATPTRREPASTRSTASSTRPRPGWAPAPWPTRPEDG